MTTTTTTITNTTPPPFIEIPSAHAPGSVKGGDETHCYVNPSSIDAVSQIAGGGAYVYIASRRFETCLDACDVVDLIGRTIAP